MTEKEEHTTYPVGPLSYTRTVQAFKEALENLATDPGLFLNLDPSERLLKRLLWRDDMENYTTMKWLAGYPADVEMAYINSVAAFEGDYVLRVQSPTDTHCECVVRFGCIKKEQKTSFEMRWHKRPSTSLGGFVGQIRSPNNMVDGYKAMLRWSALRTDGSGWEYRGADGVVRPIPNSDEVIRDNTWNYLKIVVDWENNRFYRLITNLLDLDMSNLALQNTVFPVTNPGTFTVILAFTALPGTATPYPHYVDDCRIYLNEV